MKKILLLTVILFSSLSLFAQEQRQRMTVEERAKSVTEWMSKELKLTPEQITPVDSINLIFTKAQQLLFQTADGDRTKIRESMEGLEKEKEAELSKVLTPEQIETYKKKSQEMMQNRRRGGGRGAN
ncbi:MAG: hypothetical protein LBJ72_14925 [Dysgonamonadaceae bacterium]|jgi:Spy/CpxP family protein refolding chaperone|nr:hypothetical protein [Dysgonamonadaceae bacterium]